MNEYDSQKTLEILKQDSTIEETTNPNEADIILLNTCSIREKAEEKVYSELGRLNKLKTQERMYLETMEKVLADIDKVIIENNGGSGVVPYLPLPELKKRATN